MFLNDPLPDTFSKGSAFGPGFKTQIIELDSGHEHKVQRFPDAGRRRFNVARGIAKLDDLFTLQEFYITKQGSTFAFPVKDWSDHATNPTGVTFRATDAAVTSTDQLAQLVSGSTTVYQLTKDYVSGPTTRTRAITRPISSTFLLSISDITQGSGFTLDDATGLVTFSSAPGGPVKWGGEFYTPCRFSEDADRAFQVAIEAITTGNLPEIVVVEALESVLFNQELDFGGARNFGAITADVNVIEANGRVQVFEPATTGHKLILPDTTLLPTGGPYFAFFNAGTESLRIEDTAATTLLDPFAASTGIEVWLGVSVLNLKTWYGA